MRYLLAILFLTFTSGAFGTVTCTNLFSEIPVEEFIRELAELRLQLDLNQTSNDTSLVSDVLEKEFKQKENELRQYLEKNKIMSYSDLVKKIKYQISLLQKPKDTTAEIEARKDQKAESEKALNPGKIGVFYSISEGDHTFQLMSTKTTQIIWQKVAQLINKNLGGVRHSWWLLKRPLLTNPKKEVGDLLPMHTVSYDQVQLWFKGLNELSRKNYPELKEIFDGHEANDIYYLPGKVEIDILNAINFKKIYNLDDIAWTDWDWASSPRLHPVAQKEPVIISGRPFYDLLSNIKEWIDEKSFFDDEMIMWGLELEFGKFLVRRSSMEHDKHATHVGFRVARKVKQK